MEGLTNGIHAVKFAPIGANGTMGTDFFTFGLTEENSFKIVPNSAQYEEKKSEEKSAPTARIKTSEASLGFTFKIQNPNGEAMKKLWGGTVDATTKKYTPPKVIVPAEYSMSVIPFMGYGFDVVRAQVTADFNPDYGRASLLGIDVTITILDSGSDAANFETPFYKEGGVLFTGTP